MRARGGARVRGRGRAREAARTRAGLVEQDRSASQEPKAESRCRKRKGARFPFLRARAHLRTTTPPSPLCLPIHPSEKTDCARNVYASARAYPCAGPAGPRCRRDSRSVCSVASRPIRSYEQEARRRARFASLVPRCGRGDIRWTLRVIGSGRSGRAGHCVDRFKEWAGGRTDTI